MSNIRKNKIFEFIIKMMHVLGGTFDNNFPYNSLNIKQLININFIYLYSALNPSH